MSGMNMPPHVPNFICIPSHIHTPKGTLHSSGFVTGFSSSFLEDQKARPKRLATLLLTLPSCRLFIMVYSRLLKQTAQQWSSICAVLIHYDPRTKLRDCFRHRRFLSNPQTTIVVPTLKTNEEQTRLLAVHSRRLRTGFRISRYVELTTCVLRTAIVNPSENYFHDAQVSAFPNSKRLQELFC